MKLAAFNRPVVSPSSLGDLMKQQLFWLLLLRIVLYTLIAIIGLILLDERFDTIVMPPSLLTLFILIIYLSTIVSALSLHRSDGDYRRFGFVQTLFDAVFASTLVYLTGASQSIFFSVYFFPIISGGLLIPLKGGLIGAAASTLLYAAVLGLEYFGYLPDYVLFASSLQPHDFINSTTQFGTKGLTFFLAAFISALFGTMLRSTTKELSSTRNEFDRLSILYKQIFDNITTGIVTVDGKLTITSANNATADITDLAPDEMIGLSLEELFPDIDLHSTAPRNACDFVRGDGQRIRVGYAHTPLHHSLPDDQKGAPPPPEEDITIITLKDIGEIERLEGQIRQSEKLAAIGMMSASIAHDFRNPLTAISGSAQVLAQEFAGKKAQEPQNVELIDIIVRECDRLAKKITNFLKFARPEHLNREWFDFHPFLHDILQVCQADHNWPMTCRIKLDIDPEFRIWGDEKQLFGVIGQLVQNAVPFCPAGRERIEISGANAALEGGGEVAVVSVADNGEGVKPTDLKKIFEPFFTTRPDGTGLGLAIARQTVEAHNGAISVEPAPLGGACFTLRLPLPAPDGD